MARAPIRRTRGRSAVAALPDARPLAGSKLAEAFEAAGDWVLARLAEEAELGRPALWLPVLFGVGVAIYFAAAREPALWAAIAVFIASIALVAAARRGFLTLGLALALAAAAGGFLAAKTATLRTEAPMLGYGTRADVVGRVLLVEPRRQGRRRLTLAVERFGALDDGAGPRKVRVTVAAKPELSAGGFR